MTEQYPNQPSPIQPPPPQWGPPRPPIQPAPKPPKPFYRKPWLLILVVALLGFGGCTAVLVGAIGAGIQEATDPTDATVKQAAPAPTAPDATTVAEEPAESFDTPVVADFKLEVKELTRQRFGSAGDLVDYRVQLTQVRPRTYDPDKSYELTYRITGGEDGAETQTMMVRGDEYEVYEGNASTRGGVKVKATPTGIEEV